ncbi:ATP-binding protein [Alkalihalobacillus sp. BA299]|uniref:sensor histidine kinase n=1 Tax=Alkalihalobacillus sp. BA299 TaxID=2815938 RepID=UPI001ADC5D9A|nr:ATP-binding protein [Alkalihalobacillus sp. BA299]
MQWLNQSLFRRLLVSFLTVFLLGFGIIGIVISMSTKEYITNQKKQEMLTQARNVNGAVLQSDKITPDITETIEKLSDFSQSNIWIVDKTGEIVATSSQQDLLIGELINHDTMQDVLQGNYSIQVMEIEEEERTMLSVIVPWGTNETIYGGIILHSPISGLKATVDNIREIVLWAIISVLFIVGLLVSYLSWSISKPLKRVEEAANEIALGNYNKRVKHDIPDEVGQLVNSFNRMAKKLDDIERERDSLEQRRKDFIANVSHELRTPLTGIKGFLEALQDGLVKDEESKQKYYQIMQRETEYLTHLVRDLMELIKFEKNEVTLDLYYVQIDEVIKKVCFHLQPAITENGNEIFLHLQENTPPILGDSIRLEQIFKNLIHNANKFTENGTITASIKHDSDKVFIKISDTGIGIPSYDLKRIWDRFFKVDRVRNKKGRGTGLGLAIVKELVKLHHGEVQVESKLGEGTTFTVILPIDFTANE